MRKSPQFSWQPGKLGLGLAAPLGPAWSRAAPVFLGRDLEPLSFLVGGGGRPRASGRHPIWLVVRLAQAPASPGRGQSSFLPAELWWGVDGAPPGVPERSAKGVSSCEAPNPKKVERENCTHSADGEQEAGRPLLSLAHGSCRIPTLHEIRAPLLTDGVPPDFHTVLALPGLFPRESWFGPRRGQSRGAAVLRAGWLGSPHPGGPSAVCPGPPSPSPLTGDLPAPHPFQQELRVSLGCGVRCAPQGGWSLPGRVLGSPT